jgi:hypothetical protein
LDDFAAAGIETIEDIRDTHADTDNVQNEMIA